MTSSERSLLAQELHDGIAQDLVGIGYALDLIIGNPLTSSETKIDVRKVRFNVSELTQRVRTEIHDLYRDDGGNFLDQIHSLLERVSPNLKTTLVCKKESIILDQNLAYQVLRIVGELLRNIVTHSGAVSMTIEISEFEDTFSITISDDGFADFLPDENRYGMKGAKRRAELIGGSLMWTQNEQSNSSTLRFPLT